MSALDNLFLGALVGNILSFTVGYLLHYVIDNRKRRNDLSKAAESITVELEDMQKVIYDSMTADNAGRLFQSSISAIDSVIYSGLIREFDIKTQVALLKAQAQVNSASLLLREALDYYRQHETSEIRVKLNEYQNKKIQVISNLLPGLIEQLKPYIR